MDEEHFENAVRELLGQYDDYDRRAYHFVSAAVSHTVDKIANETDSGGARHVSGQELVRGAMEYAFSEYGDLAPDVLEYWGLRTGHDLGVVVFRMIRAGILAASKEDSIGDFDSPPDLPGLLREEIRLKAAADALSAAPLPPIA